MQLRDYQQQAVDALRGAFAVGKRAPLLCLPTGGGKTVIFSYIAQSAVARQNRVMILVHRRELIQQTSETLESLGVSHGIIAAGRPMTDEPIQIASVQTLVKRLGKVREEPTLIIVDEAHHAVAGSWSKIIDHFPLAKLLGVTATPMRLDGRGLGDFFDQLIIGPSVKELTEKGHLAPVRCFTIPRKLNRKAIGISGGDFKATQAAEMLEHFKINGDAVIEYQRHCPGKPAIVFCCTIAHSEFVADLFKKAGYRAEHLSCKLDHATRKQRIKDLGNGELDILTSCNVISEGTDIPVVTAAILLRPTKSEALFLQQVGRALRPAPGKERAIIIDCVGNVLDHGLPDAERNFSLEGTQKDSDAAAPVRECPVCYAALPAATKICPVCGHVFEQQETKYKPITKVDLVEVTGQAIKKNQKLNWKQSRDRKRRIAMARTFEELDALRKEFGYKPGWTYMMMKERQPKPRLPVKPRGQDWSQLLSSAGIPEPPGYSTAAKMADDTQAL